MLPIIAGQNSLPFVWSLYPFARRIGINGVTAGAVADENVIGERRPNHANDVAVRMVEIAEPPGGLWEVNRPADVALVEAGLRVRDTAGDG